MTVSEAVIVFVAAYLGYLLRYQSLPDLVTYLPAAALFSTSLTIAMIAMGVHEARIREGFTAMMLRTAVAVFLLGALANAALSYVFPALAVDRSVLLLATLTAFLTLAVWRWLSFYFIDEDSLKARVVVLGTGQRALKIAARMRRTSDQRAFILVGFIELGSHPGTNEVEKHGARIIKADGSLPDYCRENAVDEIVVAMDERRRNQDATGGIPLEELMECRLSGLRVSDVQQFIEREAGKIDVDLLRPSWMVFSDGFITSTWRAISKRSFDLFASLLLLSVAWPLMILTAFAIWVESRFRDPVFYRQQRVGLDGRLFDVLKFRSMRTDAEEDGKAVWVKRNDARVTRVGAFIRKSRLDELPQLFNVLKGDMSFVGPRPERPVFVEELSNEVPYYEQRHRIKPGITGWAQLCYPYGASIADSKEKLQYDLYYLKNHSLLLDMIILLHTVEVVLIGEGAR